MSTLTAVIQAGVITDGFLSGVLESVKDSDNNFFRNFFLDSNDILCYQRPEDVRARVCVPGTSREAVLRVAHGDSVLAGHSGIDRTVCSGFLRILLAQFVRRRVTFRTFLCGVRCIEKFKSTAYGGGIFLIHPTSNFRQLGYGFDWTTSSN